MTNPVDPNDQTLPTDDSTATSAPATEQVSEEQILLQNLQKELEDSKTKLQDLTAISQHALADLQNYKKRSDEEKIQFLSFANANLIIEILPVLDNVERATQHIPDEAKDWAQGIVGTLKQLESVLNSQGLQKINTVEQSFDPRLHEAILTENGPQDKVIKEIQAGYLLKDKVLRPAKVSVGNGQTETPPAN
jgi:molecular chaperone GrpE